MDGFFGDCSNDSSGRYRVRTKRSTRMATTSLNAQYISDSWFYSILAQQYPTLNQANLNQAERPMHIEAQLGPLWCRIISFMIWRGVQQNLLSAFTVTAMVRNRIFQIHGFRIKFDHQQKPSRKQRKVLLKSKR